MTAIAETLHKTQIENPIFIDILRNNSISYIEKTPDGPILFIPINQPPPPLTLERLTKFYKEHTSSNKNFVLLTQTFLKEKPYVTDQTTQVFFQDHTGFVLYLDSDTANKEQILKKTNKFAKKQLENFRKLPEDIQNDFIRFVKYGVLSTDALLFAKKYWNKTNTHFAQFEKPLTQEFIQNFLNIQQKYGSPYVIPLLLSEKNAQFIQKIRVLVPDEFKTPLELDKNIDFNTLKPTDWLKILSKIANNPYTKFVAEMLSKKYQFSSKK